VARTVCWAEGEVEIVRVDCINLQKIVSIRGREDLVMNVEFWRDILDESKQQILILTTSLTDFR
jgi:hypothetical protein